MAKNCFYKIKGKVARELNLVTEGEVEVMRWDEDTMSDVYDYEYQCYVDLGGARFHRIDHWLDDEGNETEEIFFLCSSTPDLFKEYDFVTETRDW